MNSEHPHTQVESSSGDAAGLKKIAMLGSYPPLRGISSYCFGLANALASLVPIDFISFKRLYPKFLYPGGDLRDDHSFPETEVANLHVKRSLCWYNPLGWLHESFLTDGDLLHAQWWSMPLAPVYACLAAGFKLRRRPVVFTIHNVMGHECSALYFNASRQLLKLGDHFIVHSSTNRQQLVNLYGIEPHRTSLIAHGRLDFQIRGDVNRDEVREQFGFNKDDEVILIFGAIRPYKGVDTAIKAFAKIKKDIPQAKLLIAGLPWVDWTPYERLMKKLKVTSAVKAHLEYIPSDKVHQFFEASDLVLLPYHHFDSQSGVGSSAVAFKKPLIVTDVGGLPDLVADRRWVVPAGDDAALASTAITCLTNPSLTTLMAQQADKISADLDWSAIAQETISVYKRLVRHNSV